MIHRNPLLSALFAILMIAAAPRFAAADAPFSIAERLSPSLVRVEFTLQYDKGQPPRTPGFAERCPGCGRYHVQRGPQYVEEERPMEAGGYLIGPTLVLTGDIFLADRFVQSVLVRAGDHAVSAKPVAYAADHYAMLLELEKPLPGTRPLEFDAQAEGPYFTTHWQQANGRWQTETKPLSLDTVIVNPDDGRRFVPVPARGLVMTTEGVPVGAVMSEHLRADDSWRGSPESWTWITRAELDELFDACEQRASTALPRVRLEFRPSSKRQVRSSWNWDMDDDNSAMTEMNAVGVLADPQTLLVLANLEPRVTARLERIIVNLPDGDLANATFAGTLTDYGAFVATLDEPLDIPAVLDRGDIRRLENRLLISAEIELHGENRIARFSHTRIPGYEIGWRRNIYPSMAGDVENLFLFEPDGALVALPIQRRRPATDEHRRWENASTLTAAAQIASVLDSPESHYDSINVPLSEEEEQRIAWLGVEMQTLDEELARAYGVSDRTNDGTSGGIVSHVYANSPADRAGIESGDILLRVHTDKRPRPIEINVQSDMFAMYGGFPWDQLDELPEEYFDEIPQPWPSADNPVNRALTELGFGSTIQLEVHRDDEVQRIDMNVEQSPSHFDSAARYKDVSLGLTLRDMTYEVRRYYRKFEDEPGLIAARIEAGSRASVAGLKPFELITHINDVPMMTVSDFERVATEHEDLRLKVERMGRTRIVRIER